MKTRVFLLLVQSTNLFLLASALSIHKIKDELSSWHVGEWSACTTSCGGGTQSRSVVCKLMSANGALIHQEDESCSQPKPEESRECNVKESCPEWQSAPWSNCNKMCDEGEQTREVVCVLRRGANRKHLLPESHCEADSKPSTRRSCNSGPCSGFDWMTSDWSGCQHHTSCEAGRTETRLVICSSETGDVLPTEFCDTHRKPPASRPCDVAASCKAPAQWHASQWGPCSAWCGNGTQYRKVFCAVLESEHIQRRPAQDCDPATRMSELQDCYGNECSTVWFTGTFGKCSKECDGGERKRTVMCISTTTYRQVSDRNCASSFRPLDVEDCNQHRCTPDGDDDYLLLPTKSTECVHSKFGCCPDGVTPADGPRYHGCLHHDRTPEGIECAESDHGCCSDGITVALGPNDEGCPKKKEMDHGRPTSSPRHSQSTCRSSRFGCCLDGTTPRRDSEGTGCVEYMEGSGGDDSMMTICSETVHGCCPDGISSASGPDFEGCSETTIPCWQLEFGCCPDGVSFALGPNHEGCSFNPTTHAMETSPTIQYATAIPPTVDCRYGDFGCCPDGKTPAADRDHSNCGSSCAKSMYGCCVDGVTAASGMNFEGCSGASSTNTMCAYSDYGCCSDGVTSAFGPNEAGCPSKIRHGAFCKMPTETGMCGEYTIRWFFDSALGMCTRNWYSGCEIDAHHFDSEEECQAVCVAPKGLDKCYLTHSVGRCRAAAKRYFYNATARQCQTFTYGGCDGNANNFVDIDQCQQECEEPMRPDVCSQPAQTGPCRGHMQQFYFDSTTKMCMPFVYGGCQGNENRFPSVDACEKRCKQPATHVCSLPAEVGPCRAAFRKYYYNAQTGTCDLFTYGGCQGNENRFDTKEECDNTCVREIKKQRIDVCSLPEDSGPCLAYFERWRYDPADGRCKQFVYGGCQGNDNRFESEKACREACRAEPPVDVCSLPAEQGPCYDYVLRHFFDKSKGRCDYFYYGGCEGNENNFESLEECDKRCREPDTPIEESEGAMTSCTDYHGSSIPHGELYEPFSDPCHQCTCHNGERQSCMMVACRPPACDYIQIEGQCCQFQCKNETTNPTDVPDSRDRDDSYLVVDPSPDALRQIGSSDRRQPVIDDVCSLPAEQGPCYDYVLRHFFDKSKGRCDYFYYGGCEGNENNFESLEECDERCREPDMPSEEHAMKSCTDYHGNSIPHGELYKPFSDPCHQCTCHNGERQRCMTPHCQPPACDYILIEEQCCQFQCKNDTANPIEISGSHVCSLPAEQGPCYNYVLRHFFDKSKGRCDYFYYGGCEGNENNFESFEECEERCREPDTPIESSVCEQERDYGDCDEPRPVWYYEHATRTCRRFMYSGCGGNGNRFETEEACQSRCLDFQQSRPEDLTQERASDEETPEHSMRSCTDYHGNSIPHGVQYTPFSDPCFKCSCHDGEHQHCMTPHCKPPDCDWVPIEGQCCKFHCKNGTDTADPSSTDLIDVPGSLIEDPCLTDCQLDCPYGYVQGSDGCQLCRCHQPCKSVECSTTLQCKINDVICYSALCRNASSSCHHEDTPNGDAKPGQCPRSDVLHQPGGACVDLCHDDWQCTSDEKCCVTSCGGHMCMPALINTAGEEEVVKVHDHLQVTLPAAVGETVTMRCRGGDHAGSRITWYHGSDLMPTDPALYDPRLRSLDVDSLELNHVTAGDTVAFTCLNIVDDDVMTAVAQSFTLDIQEPPSFTDDRSHHRSIGPALGVTVELECPAGGNPPPLVTWHRDGYAISEDRKHAIRQDGALLLIRQIEETDGGNYECEVNNGVGEPLRRVFTVEPLIERVVQRPLGPSDIASPRQEPPAFTDDQSSHESLGPAIGSAVQLECPVRGNPTPVITWLKNGQAIQEDSNHVIRQNGELFLVRGVQDSDAANYECEVNNGVGEALRRTFTVEPLIEKSVYQPLGQAGENSPQEPPAFTDDQSSHESLGPAIGSALQLECPVRGNPTPVITWLKNGQAIQEDSNHVIRQNGELFLIRGVQDSDAANYECEANNGVGEVLRRAFTVEPLIESSVYDPLGLADNDLQRVQPAFADNGESRRSLGPALGVTVELECPVRGNPIPAITWLRNGIPIQEDSSHVVQQNGEVLAIHGLKDSDAGNYECEADNGVGEVIRRTFTVEPLIEQVVSHPLHQSKTPQPVATIPESCTDKPWYANCVLIVEASMCRHAYFSVFCCKSCYESGQLP